MDVDAALARVDQMISEGADIIEIGGESTGPNAPEVTLEEELARVLPIIRAVRSAFPSQKLAVDTYKAEIAAQALDEGVTMINDVTAGRGDADLFSVVAKAQASLVLMYAKDATPRTTVRETTYADVIATISLFLHTRKAAAIKAGIAQDHIILDPGLGHFVSSDPAYSFEIIRRLPELLSLGSPLLLSPSRKSFLAGSEQLKTIDRLPGTIAASALAVFQGASYIRTHDVLEVRRGCEVAREMRSGH